MRQEVTRFLCRDGGGGRVAIVEYQNLDASGKLSGPVERWTDQGESAEHVEGDTYRTGSGITLVRIR